MGGSSEFGGGLAGMPFASAAAAPNNDEFSLADLSISGLTTTSNYPSNATQLSLNNPDDPSRRHLSEC